MVVTWGQWMLAISITGFQHVDCRLDGLVTNWRKIKLEENFEEWSYLDGAWPSTLRSPVKGYLATFASLVGWLERTLSIRALPLWAEDVVPSQKTFPSHYMVRTYHAKFWLLCEPVSQMAWAFVWKPKKCILPMALWLWFQGCGWHCELINASEVMIVWNCRKFLSLL